MTHRAEYHYESFLLLLSFRLCFYPRSLGYLVSGSWSPKQCQVWVLSHGMGLKSKQTLASYSYKLGATIFCALAYFASRTDCRSKVLWLGWCLCFSFGRLKSTFLSKDTRMWGWRFYIGTSLTSPCSMSCVSAVFGNGALLSVCGEQPIVLTGLFGDFHGTPGQLDWI